MMHRKGAIALALATGLWASAVQAQVNAAQDALYIKGLAATCANCHGTAGQAVAGSANVTLAGLDKDYIVTQMKAFKSGARPATVMHQLSKGYSDAQIDSMAAYFAAQKK